MKAFVDDRYKIHIYLDTNILVDYVEQNNIVLNKSLDYLANCSFVVLRSSHYVEYEMTEVRKKRLFYHKVKGQYPSKDERLSGIKQKWCLDGQNYESFRDEITRMVIADFKLIEENLGVRFDDHVLHDKLILPTRDLCLATKISREDSMVMISCMHPMPDEMLTFCVLLSNDNQYEIAYNDNKSDTLSIFEKHGLVPPLFLHTDRLYNGKKYFSINNSTFAKDEDIYKFWTLLVLSLVCQKQSKSYIGHTIKIGNSVKASDLVFLDIENPKKELLESDGLIIVLHDLSEKIEINKDFDYWDNLSSVTLPHKNEKDTTYSFKPSVDEEVLKKLQAPGNLVFYYD